MAVREGLLALLREQQSYGYQLKTGFERATGGVWPLNVGQVYKTLDRLERDGLVTSTEHDGQRSYAITADGIDELGAGWEAVLADQREAVMAQLQRHQRASRRRLRPGRDDQLPERLVHDALVVRAEADLR